MNEKSIEKELDEIADTIKKLHDRLMTIFFQHKKECKDFEVLESAGRLYKAYCYLRKK